MLLASTEVELGPEWWPICRRPTAGDLDAVHFEGASQDGLVLWLEFVGERLDKELIPALKNMASLATNKVQEVRRRALQMAAHGGHVNALERFAQSEYAAPVSDQGRSGYLEEYARNCALLALESLRPEKAPDWRMSAECAALRVKLNAKEGETTDDALAEFARYVEQEVEAMRDATSWSPQRYWFSYRKCIELLIARRTVPLSDWLVPWMGDAEGFRVHCARSTDFPVVDASRALKDAAPEVALAVYQTLRKAATHGVGSVVDVEDMPFELARSDISDAACDEVLDSVVNDNELLNVVYFCQRHTRLDWLIERITALERSWRPADVAKAFTLLGFCDAGEEADSLWVSFGSRHPEDDWLADVFRASRACYERNRVAKAALADFWSTEHETEARHAWKRVEENCDRRIGLWIHEMEPPPDDAPFARLLARSLGTKCVNDAVKKDADARKKSLFHTGVGSADMAPWGA